MAEREQDGAGGGLPPEFAAAVGRAAVAVGVGVAVAATEQAARAADAVRALVARQPNPMSAVEALGLLALGLRRAAEELPAIAGEVLAGEDGGPGGASDAAH